MAAETSIIGPEVGLTGERPPEAVNDACHRIESVKRSPALRHQRARIRDRRSEHPELHGERDDGRHVAIQRVERGSPQPNRKGREHREDDQHRQQQHRRRRPDPERQSEHNHHDESNAEIDERGAHRRQREHQPGKVDLGNDVLVAHHDIGAAAERAGKISPGNQRGEIEDRIRQPLGRQLSQPAEENCEDAHGHERLDNDPEDADDGLLVTYLDVAPDEEIKEFAIGPEFAQVEIKQAARRLNPHAHEAC